MPMELFLAFLFFRSLWQIAFLRINLLIFYADYLPKNLQIYNVRPIFLNF